MSEKVKLDYLLMHTASAFLAIFLFYCIVFVANLLRIPFYLDYKEFEMNIVILTPFIDRALWVFSGLAFSTLLSISSLWKEPKGLRVIPLVLFILVVASSAFASLSNFDFFGTSVFLAGGLVFSFFSFSQTKIAFSSSKNMAVLVIMYGIFLLLLIESASLGRWVYNLFSPSLVFSNGSWNVAFAEAQISSILYPVLSVLLIIFSFSWIWELAVKGFSVKDKGPAGMHKGNYVELKFNSLRLSLLVIFASVVAVLFIGYYNFAIAGVFNPAFPGTDIPIYTQWLRSMWSLGPYEAFKYAIGNDRFLYLVLQYSIFPPWSLSPDVLVQFVMPVLLSLLLMFSTFFFVKMGRSAFHAATAMLVTVCSFAVTVGLYGGFLSNWFALVLVYGFYAVLIAVMKGCWKPVLLVLAGVLSVAVLCTHPWTWILLVLGNVVSYVVVTVLLILSRKVEMRSCVQELKFIVILLVANILISYVGLFLLRGGGGGLTGGYTDVITSNLSLINVFELKYFLDETFNWWVGGFYGYAPMMLFAILGVFSVTSYEDRYSRLLLTWILIGSSMVFTSSAPSGLPLQARFLYDMPLNIYAALGILYSGEMLFRFVDATEMRHLAPLVFWTFYSLSILFLFNYALRCVVLKQLGPPGLTASP